MRSQVTTGRGDNGLTVALNGHEYPKSHPIMECVGTLDELRNHIAIARVMMENTPELKETELNDTLKWLLHVFFAIGTDCSDPLLEKPAFHKVRINSTHLERLETEQYRLEAEVNLPRQFIIGASNRLAAQLDIACSVARRFERNLVRLKEHFPEFQADHLFAFTNRLSDFLYIAARWLDKGTYQTVDYDLIRT